MERQVDHIVRLVDDLLEVARITEDKIELRRAPLDLADVIARAVETCRTQIEAAGHELVLDLPPSPLPVHADAVRLSQVFANLLNNAAKYTEPGGKIWLSAREDGGRAVVSVRDTGVGIAPEMLTHVLEMFTRGHPSQRRAQDGLGIGLSLVRRLVEMHGGSVEAASQGIGRGSEFTVRLPIAANHREGRASERRYGFGESLAPLSVLVADDNQDAAESLGTLLRSMGADVRIVYDGKSALAALESGRPDVALLDIGMPMMDGYELARRIRERSDADEIVLIALTGWGQVDDKRRALEAGFDHHVGKPADVAELHKLMLSLRRPAPASAT